MCISTEIAVNDFNSYGRKRDECKEIITPDYDKDLIVLLYLPYLVSEGLESYFFLHRLITKTVKYTMCEYFYF